MAKRSISAVTLEVREQLAERERRRDVIKAHTTRADRNDPVFQASCAVLWGELKVLRALVHYLDGGPFDWREQPLSAMFDEEG